MSRDPKVHKGRAQRALTLPSAWEEEADVAVGGGAAIAVAVAVAAATTARPRLLLDWLSNNIYSRFQKRRPAVTQEERCRDQEKERRERAKKDLFS